MLSLLIAICAPQVHPVTMQALVRVESAGNAYAISINHPKRHERAGRELPDFAQPRGARKALELAQRLHAQGFTTSIGLAQVNTEHLPALGLELEQLLDPCTNLQLAERVLIDCLADTQALAPDHPTASLSAVLSCYHSGNSTTGITNGYTARVASAALSRTPPPPNLPGAPPAPSAASAFTSPARATLANATTTTAAAAAPETPAPLSSPNPLSTTR